MLHQKMPRFLGNENAIIFEMLIKNYKCNFFRDLLIKYFFQREMKIKTKMLV